MTVWRKLRLFNPSTLIIVCFFRGHTWLFNRFSDGKPYRSCKTCGEIQIAIHDPPESLSDIFRA